MNEENKGRLVSLTTLEVTMMLLFLVLLVGGFSLSAGYYIGTRDKGNTDIAELCWTAIKAKDGQIKAMEETRAMVDVKMGEYDKFLSGTGLEPTLSVQKKKLGVGGP